MVGTRVLRTTAGNYQPKRHEPGGCGSPALPGTTILAGNDIEGTGARSGERISLGYWFDPLPDGGRGSDLHRPVAPHLAVGLRQPNYPHPARPFFRLEPSFVGQDAELAAYPGSLQGNVQVSGSSELQTVEVLWRTRHVPHPLRPHRFPGGLAIQPA